MLQCIHFYFFTADFYLVTAGEVDSILQLPGVSSRLALRTDIVDFPLVWVSNEAGVYFNMTITSSNTDILPNPVALPTSFGNVPTDPLRELKPNIPHTTFSTTLVLKVIHVHSL